jgi:hypothetical protein
LSIEGNVSTPEHESDALATQSWRYRDFPWSLVGLLLDILAVVRVLIVIRFILPLPFSGRGEQGV